MPLKLPPYEDGAAGDKRRDAFCAKMKALLESPPRVSKKARPNPPSPSSSESESDSDDEAPAAPAALVANRFADLAWERFSAQFSYDRHGKPLVEGGESVLAIGDQQIGR